ncbi:hypothetical protein [Paucibacter soli]|uniref:hypothetical protein n=1 Tax=Paucibacter soli TaxID=3133433 RepID=UPI0030A3BCE9
MAALSRMTVGQTLFTVTSQGVGNTTQKRMAVHGVTVIAIDLDRKVVTASWNRNPAREYGERQYSKWKVKRPEVKSIF